MRSIIIFIILMAVALTECKRVLGIYGHPGKSHQTFGEVILTKLAERGHKVTMVSAFPLKDPIPNYKDIYLDGFLEEIDSDEKIYLEMGSNIFSNFLGAFKLIWHFTNRTFGHPAMHKLIQSGEKYDLIIMDWFMKDAELFYGNIFQAPIIFTCSFGAQAEVNYLTNNPEPYSYVPVSGFSFTEEMNYFDRIGNTLGALFLEAFLFYNKIQHQRILNSYFPNAPSIDELKSNVDLIFSNSHPTFESPRPYVPNIISIGGVHVQEPKPLPQDLKEFLDKSQEGVVYFSLGSHMKISALPSDILKSILRAFARIPQNVLLKWEKDEVPELPRNVKIRKWMPQNSILAHPNVKVFITHGGLMSKIEAIYHATPMIGVPLFGEQNSNVAHSVHEGIAIKLLISELNEDNLFDAISKIINDSSYSEKIKKKSVLLRDQPMKPIDTAIYWAEFVMRYNGSKHLQNKGMSLYRFQNLLLDVVLVFIVVIVSIMIIFRKLLVSVMHLLSGERTSQMVNKKKKRS
ncbi:UDP-glucuronosyltransferase 2B15 [Anoplophora glabripennis]|nr:UDP-glucuronosyltransferase 2B15 [Anoplophora glabripennis]